MILLHTVIDVTTFGFGLQVIDHALDSDKQVQDYETFTSDLLEWIEQTVVILNDRQFANSLYGVQQQLAAFNTYRTKEKPKKYTILFSPIDTTNLEYLFPVFEVLNSLGERSTLNFRSNVLIHTCFFLEVMEVR